MVLHGNYFDIRAIKYEIIYDNSCHAKNYFFLFLIFLTVDITHINHHHELVEDSENFAQRSTTNFEFNLPSPWEPLNLLTANNVIRLVNENSEMERDPAKFKSVNRQFNRL